MIKTYNNNAKYHIRSGVNKLVIVDAVAQTRLNETRKNL